MPLVKPCRPSVSSAPPPPPLCQPRVPPLSRTLLVRRSLSMAPCRLLLLLLSAGRRRSLPRGRAALLPRRPFMLLLPHLPPAVARALRRRSRRRSPPSLPSVHRRSIKPSMRQSGIAPRPWRDVTAPSIYFRRRVGAFLGLQLRVSVYSLSQPAALSCLSQPQMSQRLAQMARGPRGTPGIKPARPTSYPGLLKLSIPRCRGGGRMGRL